MGRRRRFARAASSYSRRLRVEPLEERRLLAVATVTTLGDTVDFADGVTSLREALFAANTLAGPDTIEFDPVLGQMVPRRFFLRWRWRATTALGPRRCGFRIV